MAEACDFLLDTGVRFAGIDSPNIDAVSDLARPAHTKLLGAGVPVCEHMTTRRRSRPRAGRRDARVRGHAARLRAMA